LSSFRAFLRGAPGHCDDTPRRGAPERKEHRNTFTSGERVKRIRLQTSVRRAVGFDIAEHEILQVGVSLESDASALSYRAVRPVTTHEISGADAFFPLVPVPQDAMHSIRTHREVDELDSAFDRYAVRSKVCAEERFCLRLRNEQDERKARVCGFNTAELHFGTCSALEVKHEACTGVAARYQGIRNLDRIEQLETSRLYGESA
jgi:hypothetical protein